MATRGWLSLAAWLRWTVGGLAPVAMLLIMTPSVTGLREGRGMAQRDRDITAVDLERHEVALIIGEEDGSMSVRVVTGADPSETSADAAPAPEVALALAMRLLKDPDFHEDVLDWYYEHQDDSDEEEDEE